jgi:hypothetical protein
MLRKDLKRLSIGDIIEPYSAGSGTIIVYHDKKPISVVMSFKEYQAINLKLKDTTEKAQKFDKIALSIKEDNN